MYFVFAGKRRMRGLQNARWIGSQLHTLEDGLRRSMALRSITAVNPSDTGPLTYKRDYDAFPYLQFFLKKDLER